MKRTQDKPLLRLRDDPTVPSVLRGDLSRAASDVDDNYNVAAGLVRFEASLQLGLGVPAVPSAAHAGLSAKPLLGAATKGAVWGLGAMATAGAVAAVIYASSPGRHSPSPPAPLPRTAAVTAPSDPPRINSAEASAPDPVDSMGPPPAPIAPSPSASVRPWRGVPQNAPTGELYETATPPPVPTASASADPLAPEMENLSRLRALEPTDPAQALSVAEEGHRQFPSGLFVQEREALAIAALVRLGRHAQARARAGAFMAAYPRSHFVERIARLTGVEQQR